jgi:4-aminobutyrate aminotransferase
MVGLEFVEPGGMAPAREKAKRILEETKKRGLLVGLGGFHGNVIRMAPPLSVTAEEIDRGAAILEDCIAAV